MKFLLSTILGLLLISTMQAQEVINGARAFPQPNDGSTGTTLNGTAIINTSGNAINAGTSNTAVPTYIVVGGAGTSGNANLAMLGLAPCTMDSTIASGAGNYYVINSTTAAHECHAQSAAPAAGTWVIGFLAGSSTASGSTALVLVDGFTYGGGSGSGTVNSGTKGYTAIYPATGTTVGPSSQSIDVTAYSAVGDGVYDALADASISSGSHTLTCTSCGFTSTAVDGGKLITVPGAGVSGAILSTTITSITNATTAVLAGTAAGTSVTNVAGVSYGSDNCIYLSNAFGAIPSNGATLEVPSGQFLVNPTCSISVPLNKYIRLTGAGPGISTIRLTGSSNELFLVTGTIGSPNTTITSNVAIGDGLNITGSSSIAVASTTGFVAGQWIQIADNTDTSGDCASATSNSSCQLELAQVASVIDSTHLQTTVSVDQAYASATGTVKTVTPGYFNMDHLTIDMNGFTYEGEGAIWDCLYCINGHFDHLQIIRGVGTNGSMATFRRTKRMWYEDNEDGNISGSLAGSGTYVVNFGEASAYFTMSNNNFYRAREVPVSDRSHHGAFIGNNMQGAYSDCFNTHGTSNYSIQFIGNRCSGTPTTPSGSISNRCYQVGQGTSGKDLDHDILIQGNTCENQTGCVSVEGTYSGSDVPTGNTYNISIVDNHCLNMLTTANSVIYAVGVTNLTVTGNQIKNFGNGSSGANGIGLIANSVVTLDGNDVWNTLGLASNSCFYVIDEQNFAMTGNSSKGCDYDYYMDSIAVGQFDNATITGNVSADGAADGMWWINPGNFTHLIANNNTGDNGGYTIMQGVPAFFYVTTDFTAASNTSFQLITGLTWTMPASQALNVPFECHLAYDQTVGAVSDSFGIQDVTDAPTNIFATGSVQISAGPPSTYTAGTLATLSSTTATAIVTFTPGASGTIYTADLHGWIQQPSNTTTSAIDIMVKSTTGADENIIKQGSWCRVN